MSEEHSRYVGRLDERRRTVVSHGKAVSGEVEPYFSVDTHHYILVADAFELANLDIRAGSPWVGPDISVGDSGAASGLHSTGKILVSIHSYRPGPDELEHLFRYLDDVMRRLYHPLYHLVADECSSPHTGSTPVLDARDTNVFNLDTGVAGDVDWMLLFAIGQLNFLGSHGIFTFCRRDLKGLRG